MISLTTKALQSTIEVGGNAFLIKTDFREWLKFGELLQTQQQIDISFLFVDEVPTETQEAFEKLIEFYKDDNIYPKNEGNTQGEPIIDMKNDGDFIFCEFMKKYHINLAREDLHYHEFRALFNGLNLDYDSILKIRSYQGSDTNQLREKQKWSVGQTRPLHDEETERLYNLLK